MDGSWSLVTAPATEPLTAAEAKLHLKVEISDDDTLVDRNIETLRRHVEMYTRRALVTQTWDLFLDRFPCYDAVRNPWSSIRVPKPPLQTVTWIKYYDTDGVLQTLSASNYTVDTSKEPGRVHLAYNATWPTTRVMPNAVNVRFVCGYGAASAVDPRAKNAILAWLHDLYRNRGSVVVGTSSGELPFSAKQLLDGLSVFEAVA